MRERLHLSRLSIATLLLNSALAAVQPLFGIWWVEPQLYPCMLLSRKAMWMVNGSWGTVCAVPLLPHALAPNA